MLKSSAIVGNIPPTINSTNPTATVDNAIIKTFKFILYFYPFLVNIKRNDPEGPLQKTIKKS
ncbi:hypothetical protein AB1282_03025 [Gottfriedia sp. S16(2024)]|uniref:hypothetical protein n=1 Tax=Gottfriedia sp. S16(2024) TaxID=3162883 RepID=UPI003D256153